MTNDLSRRVALTALAFGLGLASLATPALAQSRTGGAPHSMYAGIGLKGYDPVAYFTGGKAQQGLETITATNAGLTWRFATVENQKAFQNEPGKYLPQYGGFCAWGVANGKLFDIDPVNGWTVTDGKLFVVFNGDILKLFKADQTALVAKAEQNWPQLNR
ncbi:MAG: YHS domain-containing (seleno)protein [Beijerinckiaceae bacterium]